MVIDTTVAAKAATITNNLFRNVKPGGACILAGAGGSDVLWVQNGNRYDGSEVFYAGQQVIPIERTPRVSAVSGTAAFHTRYICASAAASSGITPPAGPTYVQGDLCEFPDAASGACAISRRGASTWASLIAVP